MNRNHAIITGIVTLLLIIVSAGCQRLPDAGAARAPLATPTPRSTPFPAVPTPEPVGTVRNPLQLIFVRGDRTPSAADVTALTAALSEASGMTIRVSTVADDAAALAALCGTQGRASAVWLNGLSYAAAAAAGCGDVVFQAQRRDAAGEPVDGDTILLIANRALGVEEIADLSNRIVCRLSATDRNTWLIPLLMLSAAGITSLSDLSSVRDNADLETMIDAVASGQCAAAGLSARDYAALGANSAALITLAESPLIPHALLLYPPRLFEGERAKVTAALNTLTESSPDVLRPFLDFETITPVSDRDFAALRTFIKRAGVDLAALAR